MRTWRRHRLSSSRQRGVHEGGGWLFSASPATAALWAACQGADGHSCSSLSDRQQLGGELVVRDNTVFCPLKVKVIHDSIYKSRIRLSKVAFSALVVCDETRKQDCKCPLQLREEF